jgi:mono/diheme cytochrome c family protein
MNSLSRTLLFSSLLLVAGTVAAEVVIKQVPMTARDVAGLNGEGLYTQLCSVCHGVDGKGDGAATPALENEVPDLTQLTTGGEGRYTHKRLESVIAGRNRTVHQDFAGMPLWEIEFQYVHSNDGRPRTTYARSKIHSLTEYVEQLALASTD